MKSHLRGPKISPSENDAIMSHFLSVSCSNRNTYGLKTVNYLWSTHNVVGKM